MSDRPPPRKKSRFFSNGKSKIGNILHPFKKSSQHRDDPNKSEPKASTSAGTNQPINTASPSYTFPPNQSRQEVASTILPSTEPSSATAAAAPPPLGSVSFTPNVPTTTFEFRRASGVDSSRVQISSRKPTKRRRRSQRIMSDSEAETDVEEGDDDEPGQTEELGQSDTENADPQNPAHATASSSSSSSPSLPERATIRDRRREGIYGVESLLAQNPGLSGTATQDPAANAEPTRSVSHGPTNSIANPNRPFASFLLPTGGTPPYVDIDRDARGRRLPRPPPISYLPNVAPVFQRGQLPPEFAASLLKPLPLATPAPHLANPESLVPEHEYTAPNRVYHAQHYARISLKRKRPETILPPPSYVWKRTNDPNFNVFQGILLYPELVFALASVLPVRDLISLYAISKDFHTIIDTRFTTVVLSQAVRKAPESARTFSFRSYAHLCRQDPVARIPHPNIRKAEQNVARKIPSFRWLQMVLHREKVVHEMMAVFAEDGIPLPYRCRLAIKRLWFMLDIPDNARRIGYCHNKRLMTDFDLHFAACFFTKLDMRLNDPTAGEKRDHMRKLLLSQRSFTTILKVLKRDIWTSRFAILKEWIKLRHTPLQDERSMTVFGIPPDQAGRGRLEYWGIRSAEQLGREPETLLRPDQLIVREAFRRGIPFGEDYIRFVLYGYVRPDTLDNYAPRKYGRRIDALKDDEYEIDDAIGGVAALGIGDDGFDDLLDLGPPREGGIYTIVKEKTSKAEMELRQSQERLLKRCLEWWEREHTELLDSEATQEQESSATAETDVD
ncbi:hypothetical protein HRR83_008231 [Exophiala dermatitidis]|uniref:F-box domain-containing protein n=2 Tax=Exophiala dermatitidis TaxID=5970 RepID=H6BSI7_EXODN|nr:uncharacterized protein HMPREF1120_02369 [Exophiala dermatitidis NIH/UT8656]KAJ4505793.1 hypothetical protein HRR75_007173 [Exophiala dermatitidis]EHY54195.1 hypothetical protein HMPREF1120_02369 [Exophiala dermatitidis NIH/UT8656]KAJ4507930.1 hypothetical protein HRR74_007814 [Exophiala dermatitidis]KAJ4513659.1 hypothetical protein HRR73_005818 [Exophiala dermatitidis]KAJ4535493.1 hypothetical protein HRR77_007813 [Exophiala dermatitidis]